MASSCSSEKGGSDSAISCAKRGKQGQLGCGEYRRTRRGERDAPLRLPASRALLPCVAAEQASLPRPAGPPSPAAPPGCRVSAQACRGAPRAGLCSGAVEVRHEARRMCSAPGTAAWEGRGGGPGRGGGEGARRVNRSRPCWRKRSGALLRACQIRSGDQLAARSSVTESRWSEPSSTHCGSPRG